MEDKWFIFLENDWLSVHRSWTGYCIYKVRLQATDEGYAIAEAWVNREVEQYNSTAFRSEFDADMLKFLLERGLLDKDVPFSSPLDYLSPNSHQGV